MTLQPQLPAESSYNEVEREFIALSPPGLWPDNQDSNFGQFRKVFSDILQECIDEINHLSLEAFVFSAEEYLSLWEQEVGIPVNEGQDAQLRRAAVSSRLKTSLFTRTMRREIVESFVVATFGPAVTLTPSGISLTFDGVPLYSGVVSLEGTYVITENIEDFSYAVVIDPAVTVDVAALERALRQVTPAHYSFTVAFGTASSGESTYGEGVYGEATYGG